MLLRVVSYISFRYEKEIHSCLYVCIYIFNTTSLGFSALLSGLLIYFSKFSQPSPLSAWNFYSLFTPSTLNESYTLRFQILVCFWILFILFNPSHIACQSKDNELTVIYYFHMIDIIYTLSTVLITNKGEGIIFLILQIKKQRLNKFILCIIRV